MDDMHQQVRYQLWIAAAAIVVFFTNLGGTGLWDMDEALYSDCAREMLDRGDWVVPWFNGRMFPEKPPLMFWSMMAGYGICGVNEWGARLFSAVFGVATALAAFHLGRILFNVRVGLWTGLITATTVIFTVSARAATVDSALTFVTTAAFLFFAMARTSRQNEGVTKFGLGYAVAMYACIGAAVLAKGPVGMLLPLAAMGFFLLVADGWRNVGRSTLWMRPITAVVVILAVALPWYVWVGVRTDGEWLRKFFIEFNLRPFKEPILTHGDTGSLTKILAVLVSILYYFYHVPAILVGFFPWSVFLGPTLVDVLQLRKKTISAAGRDGYLLAICWFSVWFVFWSVCKTKLPHYLMPAYPALALLVACFVDRWQTEPAGVPRFWLRNAWLSLVLVGVSLAIVMPILAAIFVPGEAATGLLGLVLIVGGAWCWWNTSHERRQLAAFAMTFTAIVFLVGVFAWAASCVDRHQNTQPVIAAIRADAGVARPAIATYRFFRESLVCYAGYPVLRCNDNEAPGQSAAEMLRHFAASPKPAYLVTLTEHLVEIERECPGRLHEIFRQRLLGEPSGGNEVVVLRVK